MDVKLPHLRALIIQSSAAFSEYTEHVYGLFWAMGLFKEQPIAEAP